MSTRTVTGTCFHVDGTAWASGVIKFRLLEAFETPTEVYPAEEHSETLDANGAFSITLGVPATGTAHYLITTPDGARYESHLASGAATDLVTILTIATTSVEQDDLQTLLDARDVLTIKDVTTTHLIDDTEDLIRCNGTFTVTLPPATGSGNVYIVKNVGTGVIALAADAGDLIDGAASVTIAALDWYTVADAAENVWDVI